MNFLNIIFMLTCYPIIFILYFMMRNAKDRNGWCFGATLTHEQKKDAVVEEIAVQYQKSLKQSMIILACMPIPVFFIPYMSIVLTYWMVWLLILSFYPMVLYAKANKKILERKACCGWGEKSLESYADLKTACVPSQIKLVEFFPSFLLSAIPVVLSYLLFSDAGYSAFRICVLLIAVCTPLFYFLAKWTDRQKISVISENSDINLNFARAKKYVWKWFWVSCAWVNTAFTWILLLAMYIRESSMAILIWGTVAYSIILMILTAVLLKKMHAINQKYEKQRTLTNASDDDTYWVYGLMYYNPNDKHIMVENRMGTGTAMNMATGVGKATYIFSSLCILVIPILCIWLILLDFTPIQTEIKENSIVCTHLKEEYRIPLDEIIEYKVLTEMPDVIKVNGNGLEQVCTGTFEIYREGMFEAFYNPNNHLFLKIETEDETYYISGADDISTQKIEEVLSGL